MIIILMFVCNNETRIQSCKYAYVRMETMLLFSFSTLSYPGGGDGLFSVHACLFILYVGHVTLGQLLWAWPYWLFGLCRVDRLAVEHVRVKCVTATVKQGLPLFNCSTVVKGYCCERFCTRPRCVTMFCDDSICKIFVNNDNVCISLRAYCLINDSTTKFPLSPQ